MGPSYLVLMALLLTLLPMPGMGQATSTATVREDQVALRSRASGGSTAIKSLGRGQKVKVGFTISGSEGSWCSVTEDAPGGASGYVLCAQLNRPMSEKRPEWRSAPSGDSAAAGQPQTPEPGRPVAAVAAAQNPSEAKVNELLLHNYDPYYWADRLTFTVAQQERLASLLRESEVISCSEATRRVLGRYGIRDFVSFATAAGDPAMKSFEREFTVEFEACSVRLASFWQRFPEILNTDQKSRFDADRRLVPESSGFVESQMRLMFGKSPTERR